MVGSPLQVATAGTLPSSFPFQRFQGRAEIHAARTDEELRTLSRKCNVLYSWQIPAGVPAETPELRWVQLPSAGADHLLTLPVWRSDLLITSSAGIHTVPMAEHLFAMLLGLVRSIPPIVRAQMEREWTHDSPARPLGLTEIRGKTMGIVGWGKIGQGVSHLARAFGMRVVGTRFSLAVPREVPGDGCTEFSDPPWLEPVVLSPDVAYPAAQLHEILPACDVVVVILPLTETTRGLIGRQEFGAMKRGCLFFNIGRGPVVDEAALIQALQSGHLAGAGLDVFAQEPLPRASPLWTMPNVIVSPHLGGVSDRTRERGAHFFAVNLERYLDGQPLLNVVDRSHQY